MMDGSIGINPNGSLVVYKLWGAVGEVVSYTSRLIEPLFNTIGVTVEEKSPFCCIFLYPTDFQGKFIAYITKTYSFGDASGTAEPSNKNDEACDAPYATTEEIVLEQVRMFADKFLRDKANSDEYSDGDDI